MELAVHLNKPQHVQALNDLSGHLSTLYEDHAINDWDGFVRDSRGSFRLYLGDEFCIHRLPSIDVLNAICQVAKGNFRGLTFLTPPLTDDGIDRCGPLFDILKGMDLGTEVVVNDWGVLLFLKENYPSFQLSVGRLLNKGFKDPRLTDPDEALTLSAETADLFNTCTFDSVEFPAKMRELNVTRVERDLLPFGESEIKRHGELQTSVYFPFGYITTGRVCWMNSFHRVAGRKFSISNGCRRTCQKISLKLNHAKTDLQLFQTGNTIFYLYPHSKLAALVKQAETQKLRLVYQGLIT